jgi:hypothetical protein
VRAVLLLLIIMFGSGGRLAVLVVLLLSLVAVDVSGSGDFPVCARLETEVDVSRAIQGGLLALYKKKGGSVDRAVDPRWR